MLATPFYLESVRKTEETIKVAKPAATVNDRASGTARRVQVFRKVWLG
jgi:hypothetical protein